LKIQGKKLSKPCFPPPPKKQAKDMKGKDIRIEIKAMKRY
jgi:hypothetical protein